MRDYPSTASPTEIPKAITKLEYKKMDEMYLYVQFHEKRAINIFDE